MKTEIHTKIIQKTVLSLACDSAVFLLCYRRTITRLGGDFLTIEEYIKSKPKFDNMKFVTIYSTILELIADGYIDKSAFDRGEKSA